MQLASLLRILGVFLIVYSFTMLIPICVDWYFAEKNYEPYLLAFLFTFGTGFILWYVFRSCNHELKIADGFLIVVLFWFVLSLFGSIPFMMLGQHPMINFVDALFEAVSGLTTTGASILTDLDHMSLSIRYYRAQLQFLGGMGIIVLAVAILPVLGIGGLQLYRAEVPGPIKESKLTPRITETAKTLWYIYVGLTISCILAYWAAGMDWIEAICEGFATTSTGGFSLHQQSFAYYDSRMIELIAIVFMILGATSFSLHFITINRLRLQHYWQDEEFRTFIYWLMIGTGAVYIGLLYHAVQNEAYPFLHALFAVVSLSTTTGFVASSFANWPAYIPLLIMIWAIIGGCAGSTCGGIKIIRMMLLKKQVNRELHQLIHPQAVMVIRFGSLILPNQVLQAMWGFLAAFFSIFTLSVLLLLAAGMDAISSFGAVASTLTNAGAGIGSISENFHELSNISKYILILDMLAGRLEIYTLLILFTSIFWRK